MVMRALLEFVLDALFPPQCIPCGEKLPRTARFLSCCDACLKNIPMRSGFSCAQCGRRLPLPQNTCHRGTPAVAAATDFTDASAQALIYALKYSGLTDAARPLAALLHAHLVRHPSLHALARPVLVPIPLHPKRLRTRGFNQSELVARELSRLLSDTLPTDAASLVRTANTTTQTAEATREKRRKNVRGAFAVADASRIRGATVLLVDDVCTSGGTLTEAARALRAAGAAHIIGLVIARA